MIIVLLKCVLPRGFHWCLCCKRVENTKVPTSRSNRRCKQEKRLEKNEQESKGSVENTSIEIGNSIRAYLFLCSRRTRNQSDFFFFSVCSRAGYQILSTPSHHMIICYHTKHFGAIYKHWAWWRGMIVMHTLLFLSGAAAGCGSRWSRLKSFSSRLNKGIAF